jgi:4-hydroxybenzoate polyprenyltransferase
MKKISALFILARPLNLFFVILAQVLCAYYVIHLKYSIDLAILFLGTTAVTAAGYMINDYFDVKADAINKPKKVFVGRKVSRLETLLFVFIFNTCTLIAILFSSLPRLYFWIFLSTIFCLWLYSYLLKRSFLAGNLLVAFFSAYSIFILSYLGRSNNVLLSLTGFAFLSNLIREIIKDCEDLKGDLLLNSRTIPIVLGLTVSKGIVLALNLVFIAAIWVVYLNNGNDNLITSVLVISALMVYVSYLMLDGKHPNFNFKMASNILKIVMLVGCLSIPLI